jgi:hypothetical protein
MFGEGKKGNGMSVSLKDFVRQTLLDITNAVDEAKSRSPLSIAPGFVEGTIQLEPQMIEFSVQVSALEEKSSKGQGQLSIPIVTVLKASASGDITSSNEKTTTHTLKFSVPVYFQSRPAPMVSEQ